MNVYSIGYQRIAPERLDHIARALGALVVDVRAVPFSRKPGFSRKALETRLGDRYAWKGETLGNRAPNVTTPAGLDWIREQSQTSTLLLMCMEEAPGECHRHLTIATDLLPAIDVKHICDDEVIDASEFQRAIDADDDYDCEDLEELLAGLRSVA